MFNLEQTIRDQLSDGRTECLFAEPMKNHTTFRVGGPARAFVRPADQEALRSVLRVCEENGIEYIILGNGSNLLVSDEGYDGVVISLEQGWSDCRTVGNVLAAGGAVSLAAAARKAKEQSLAGFEFAAGIPGTVGGAVVMNAGAYGSEMKDVLRRVRVMTREGEVLSLEAGQLSLGYRASCILKRGYVVLEAEFALTPGDSEAIGARMSGLAARRREKQPLEYPSAGSTFKRPAGNFAGKLIEEAGLRGVRVGGAQVSEKHCGFVINRDNATAADVMELCRLVMQRVKENSGVELEMEVKRLGRF